MPAAETASCSELTNERITRLAVVSISEHKVQDVCLVRMSSSHKRCLTRPLSKPADVEVRSEEDAGRRGGGEASQQLSVLAVHPHLLPIDTRYARPDKDVPVRC